VRRQTVSIFKRGSVYWFHFVFDGKHVQMSTKQGNARVARQIEAAHKIELAKGLVGIEKRKPAPTLREFAPTFRGHSAVLKRKAKTVEFYNSKLDRLLEFGPLASARLDRVDEALIERYIQCRQKAVSPSSINRELATLSKLLRIAAKERIIPRSSLPSIERLPGERSRDFVLSYSDEAKYLEIAPQPLADAALLMLETGLRVGELVALLKSDIHLEPIGEARLGYLRVRRGKSEKATRSISLTPRATRILRARMAGNTSRWVFPGEGKSEGKGDSPFLATSLDQAHARVRSELGWSRDFVLHSLRHTFLTRLGEQGVDCFTIMRVAGHSTITTSQKYIHPSDEQMERAFERLEKDPNRQVAATLSATSAETISDSVM
jgi:integrase